MSDSRNRFVVGIDYGTTYSGAAYLYIDPDKEPDYSKIKVIQSWPAGDGTDNRTLDKVPTEISFEDGQTCWGYEIPEDTARYSCFKLLLDEKASKTTYDDPNLPDRVDDSPRPSLPDGKTVHDVTFEYLRLLYAHVMEHLRNHIPKTFDSTPIQFVLTVPAIWSHAAQRATRDAAKRAGFGSRNGDRITMVGEPEAAGAYCLREMHEGSGNELKVGERILICDAGGGTVDLTTYAISEVTPCLRVREAVEGSGGKCGSTAIDRAFLKLVKPLLDEADQKSKKDRVSKLKTERGGSLMNAFESAKRAFGPTTQRKKWRIPIGNIDDDEAKGFDDGHFILTREHMTQFFNPIVERILDLAATQIRKANDNGGKNMVSKILLVGGFAESAFLRKKLSDWCQTQPFPVDVIKPLHPWTAVVRGAVIHGIQSLVDSRKLKEHYGLRLGAPYNPRLYDNDSSYFDPLCGFLMTDDHVEWFAVKGQEAANGQHFAIGGWSTFPDWLDRKFTISIMGSKSEPAPVSIKRGDVYQVGRVEADLSSVPESAFSVVRTLSCQCHGGANKILNADISIEMSVSSADLKFEVMFKGESYGKTRIEYHHDDQHNDLHNHLSNMHIQ